MSHINDPLFLMFVLTLALLKVGVITGFAVFFFYSSSIVECFSTTERLRLNLHRWSINSTLPSCTWLIILAIKPKHQMLHGFHWPFPLSLFSLHFSTETIPALVNVAQCFHFSRFACKVNHYWSVELFSRLSLHWLIWCLCRVFFSDSLNPSRS